MLQLLLHYYNLSHSANPQLIWSISLQPILHCYDLFRYSQYQIAMIYLVTANTTLLWSIPLQPILHCYDLSRHSQYYIAITYLATANTTFLWSISLQPILNCYDLSCYSQYYIAITISTLWHLIQQPIYLYTTWSQSLCYDTWYSNLTYYHTTMIQQAFLCLGWSTYVK